MNRIIQRKEPEQPDNELANLKSLVGKQGKELGDLRQKVGQNQTHDEIKKELTVEDTKEALPQAKTKLNTIDPYLDEEDYQKQKNLVSQIETDYLDKRQDKAIRERFNSEDNQKFLEETKEDFKKQGIDLSDEEFTEVSETAKEYQQDGKLTKDAMFKAMIDKVGIDKVQKFFTVSGEQKAREDITQAHTKKDNKISTDGSGKVGKFTRLHDMSPHDRDKFLDSLPPAELDRLEKLYKN